MAEKVIDTATVARGLDAAGLDSSREPVAALTVYLNLLRRWNRVFNLTGIHDPNELVERHLAESLALRPLLRGEHVADVGTGAGLPGIPLAAAEPERRFVLVESRAKRVRFLRHVCATLGLVNATVEHCRVEDLPSETPFATVLARAVAPPAELIRITRPLTVPGSILLLLTATHLRGSLADAASDFVAREVAGNVSLRSTIVMLERV